MPEFRTLTATTRETTVYITADDLRALVGAPKDATVRIDDSQRICVIYTECLGVVQGTRHRAYTI